MYILALTGLWYALTALGGVVIGVVIGFFVTRKIFKMQMQKNPPINEKMIRAMYSQMGQKPSEAKIKQIMNAMKQQSK